MRFWPRNRSIESGSPQKSDMRPSLESREQERRAEPTTRVGSTSPANDGKAAHHGTSLKSVMGRISSSRTLTLSIDDDTVRAVVFKGKRIVKWGFTSLTRTEEGNDAVAELRELLKDLGINYERTIADLPIQVPVVRQLHSPIVRGKFFGEVVESELLDCIPFVASEVDITWQAQSNGQYVTATAVPKSAIDKRVRFLNQAGVQTSAIYSRSVALAFAIDLPKAMIVHIGENRADIVIADEGIPVVAREIELPLEEGDQTAIGVVLRAIEQVYDYSQDTESGMDTRAFPIVLIGPEPLTAQLTTTLEQDLKQEVGAFRPNLVCPADFPFGEYAVNLGLMLSYEAKARSGKGNRRTPGPSTNLLPARHVPFSLASLPKGPILGFSSLLMLGALAFYCSGWVQALESEVDTRSAPLQELKNKDREQRLSLARLANIQEQARGSEEQTSSLVTMLETRQQELSLLLEQLQTIKSVSTDHALHPASVARQSDKFVLEGKGPGFQDVYDCAAALLQSGQFNDVHVVRIQALNVSQNSEDQLLVSFRIEAFLTTDESSDVIGGIGDVSR